MAEPSDYNPQDDPFTEARRAMVAEQLAARGVSDERVLAAMMAVPRHLFVPYEYERLAYEDHPLHIGYDQTISQPFMVGWMTQLLRLKPDDRVLEIGVGSGYQTAILARLVSGVVGVERLPKLAAQAIERLSQLDINNVRVIEADGTRGVAAYAPYDGILVAAASPGIPEPLVEQLADGGRLVIPVGMGKTQMLERATRRGGALHIERLGAVRFVPLIGAHGFD